MSGLVLPRRFRSGGGTIVGGIADTTDPRWLLYADMTGITGTSVPDQSSYNNPGTIINTATEDATGGPDGGPCLVFANATSGRLTFPDVIPDTRTGGITFGYWMYVDTGCPVNTGGMRFNASGWGVQVFGNRIHSNASIGFGATWNTDVVSNQPVNSPPLVSDAWYLYIYEISETATQNIWSAKLYRCNNASVELWAESSALAGTQFPDSILGLTFAGWDYTNSTINGRLGPCFVFDGVMTDEERQTVTDMGLGL